MAPMPMTSVRTFHLAQMRDERRRDLGQGKMCPPAGMPRMCLIWLAAIRMPDAGDEARDHPDG